MSAVKVKDPHPSGLDFYRDIDEFKAAVRFPGITIWYYEFLVYPNGTKSDETRKKYLLMDIPAIKRKGDPILISPAIPGVEAVYEKDQDGNPAIDQDGNAIILTPAVPPQPAQYNYDVPDVIVKPANTGYADWRAKIIPQEAVGMKLGDDLIIGAINQSLADFPWNVKDGHIIGEQD